MFDKEKKRFVVGEELTLEDIRVIGGLNRACSKALNESLTRDEKLFIKYCYALNNALYYIPLNGDSTLKHSKKEESERKAMVDMFAYILNQESLAMLSPSNKVKFAEFSLPQVQGYSQDIIEFALLQAGKRVVCEKYRYGDLDSSRFNLDLYYETKPCEPISMKELTDSIGAKIEAEYAKEFE